MKKSLALFLAIAITCLLFINLSFFRSAPKNQERETVFVARVIDGDTLETQDRRTLRLLNINTPEKNHPGSEQAVSFLKTIENQTVEIESLSTDKYQRTLARIYSPNYLNLEIVRSGLATKFLVNEEELKEFAEAEKSAVDNERGIWQHSRYFGCFKSDIDFQKEVVHLKSLCGSINFASWTLRDESRKEYKFPSISSNELTIHSSSGKDSLSDLFWNQKTDVWNNDRDTLYLLDADSNLAHYQTYGYS